MDANTTVGSIMDFVHVGPSNDGTRDFDVEAAALLHSFLCQCGLALVNTFSDGDGASTHTRFNWEGSTSAQIDFIASSLGLGCSDVSLDHCLTFRTDHRMIVATYTVAAPARDIGPRATVRNWKPSEEWADAAKAIDWSCGDWTQLSMGLSGTRKLPNRFIVS